MLVKLWTSVNRYWYLFLSFGVLILLASALLFFDLELYPDEMSVPSNGGGYGSGYGGGSDWIEDLKTICAALVPLIGAIAALLGAVAGVLKAIVALRAKPREIPLG